MRRRNVSAPRLRPEEYSEPDEMGCGLLSVRSKGSDLALENTMLQARDAVGFVPAVVER